MSRFLQDKIVPYKGTDSFPFGARIEDVRKELTACKIRFNQYIESHKGCTPDIPWTIIHFDSSITLCFVEGILFEIVLEKDYHGLLPNGIGIGMDMEEIPARDPSLIFNEDDEDFISKEGYWLEDDPETHKVKAITIFVKDAEDSTSFFTYNWINNFTNPS